MSALLGGFLNNVGAAYNLAIVGLVLAALEQSDSLSSTEGARPGASAWPTDRGAGDRSLVASGGVFGAMAGQLAMGLLGDLAGRRAALILTTLLIVLGSILSATLPQGDSLLFTLAICRIVTGLGVGGVYPLTAVASAESLAAAESRGRSMLLVFSGQGFGQVFAPLVVYLLVAANVGPDQAWRAALGLGALPSLVSLLLMCRREAMTDSVEARILRAAGDHPDNVAFHEEQARFREHNEVLHEAEDGSAGASLGALLTDRRLLRKLVGTGGTWFLFDTAFYANVVGVPMVLESMFKVDMSAAGVETIAGPTTLILLIGLPGYFLSVLLVDRIGLKRLQIAGFVTLSVLYCVLALTAKALPPALLFALYGCTFLFSNFGPNATTFCLPAQTFPKRARATYNGISAALGKSGAVLGTAVFPVIIDQGGLEAVLGSSAGLAMAGALLTYWAVDVHEVAGKVAVRRGSDASFVEMSTTTALFAAVEDPPPQAKMFSERSRGGGDGGNPFAEVERQLNRL